jgi:DNA-binding response OmpR family regulator
VTAVRSDAPLVLVADDDADILALVTFRLERSGCRVLRAADGAEALELARERQPDLAVLDVMMPRLTGLEVARALREDDRTRELPVILLTARVRDSDVQAGLEAGATSYVRKPFSARELWERVEALLPSA